MAKPRTGLSMLYLLGKTFSEMTEHLVKTEAEYVEIVDDGFHSLDQQKVSTLKTIGDSYGLKYSIHAPFADMNIASPSKPMLRAVLKRLKKSIAYAHALDAYMWVFHPGVKTGISMFYPGMDWLRNLESARSLLKTADEYGVKIAIENVPEPYPFLMKNVEDFKRFYTEIDENIGLALDIGHANINGQTELFIANFKHEIVHMHLSDNNGKMDEHLGIGHGMIQWDKVAGLMRGISYDKIAVVESVEHVVESVEKVKQLFA